MTKKFSKSFNEMLQFLWCRDFEHSVYVQSGA